MARQVTYIPADLDPTAQYRVTYIDSGLRRHTRNVDLDYLRYYAQAWYAGIRVTSYRKITAAA